MERRKIDYSTGFFAYGGMKPSQRYTKVHISNPNGVPLCGVNSNWMEATSKLNEYGIIADMTHIFKTHSQQNTCLKCLKKFKEIKTTTTPNPNN